MKLGFIGCGNMAKPIIKGINKSNIVDGGIYVCDINREALSTFCVAENVNISTQEEITSLCDCIFLAVKPQVLPSVLTEISDSVNKRNIFIVSIAAGKTTEYISSYFNSDIAVARIFPNLNAEVRAAVSAYCANGNIKPEQLEFVKKCCESFGSAFYVTEDKINIFGVLGGCAPAYTFMYINALAKAAEEAGFDSALAYKVAAEMAGGSAKLLSSSVLSAEELITKVCSPGGTTIEGITSLRDNNFEAVVKNAFNASLARDKELSK